MKNFILNGIVSVVISTIIVAGFYLYFPLSWFENLQPQRQTFGSTITTINGSDTISSSRSVINTNFSNLNTDKLEISTFLATTSMPTLANIGTILTGVWNATAIGVGYGGTGTTSPTTNQVILGNGASGLKVVNGFGTTGQFLTSNGAATAPTWQTSAVDAAIDYSWTGNHTFGGTGTTTISNFLAVTKNATSTFSAGVYASLFSAPYFNATSTTATSTFPSLQVSGTATTTNMIVSGTCKNCAGNGYEIITGSMGNLNAGSPSLAGSVVSGTAVASCTAGKIAIGGGVDGTTVTGMYMFESFPDGNPATGWKVSMQGPNGSSAAAGTGYVICVNP